MSDFEGMLAEEQTDVEDRREAIAAAAAASSAPSYGSYGAAEAGGESGEEGGAVSGETGSSAGSSTVPGGGAVASSSSGAGPIPEDVSDGSDDDVVARQLREAAMSEEDPELREKLWDEYRAYKTGAAPESGDKKKGEAKSEEADDGNDS
jgi:hypothetical protein